MLKNIFLMVRVFTPWGSVFRGSSSWLCKEKHSKQTFTIPSSPVSTLPPGTGPTGDVSALPLKHLPSGELSSWSRTDHVILIHWFFPHRRRPTCKWAWTKKGMNTDAQFRESSHSGENLICTDDSRGVWCQTHLAHSFCDDYSPG